MNLLALLAADPNLAPAMRRVFSQPASPEAIDERNRDEWADGAQQRSQDARAERERREEGL